MGYPFAKIINGVWYSCDLQLAQHICWEWEQLNRTWLSELLRFNDSSWVYPDEIAKSPLS
jgi:hypothetical protein